MEHIVQFAIGIDDETIRKNVTARAEKEITESIRVDVERSMFNESLYTFGEKLDKSVPKEWVCDIVKKVIEDNKDRIIECAIEELARNMMKTKAVKEAIGKAVKNG
jgi:hypothetical protein